MSINFQGTQIQRVVFNGVQLDQVIFNDVLVYQKNVPITLTVSYDGNVDTTNRYGRSTPQSPYTRNGWRDVVTRPVTPTQATGETFYYKIDANVYWQANGSSCTGLQFRIADDDGHVVTFASKVPTTGRGSKHIVFNAESSVWLGNTSNLKVSLYYTTQDSAGNYMYAAYYGTSYPVTITMSNNPI